MSPLRAPALVLILQGAAAWSACADVLRLEAALSAPNRCMQDTDCPPDSQCSNNRCRQVFCAAGSKPTCNGLFVEECTTDGKWKMRDRPCPELCSAGSCEHSPSCASGLTCPADSSCCQSLVVPGGDFTLTYYVDAKDEAAERTPDSVQRHVAKFALDKYEVTFGRFREFFAAYEQEGRDLLPGAGAPITHPEAGWQAAWSDDRVLLPPTADSVRKLLIGAQDIGTDDVDPQLPIRGVPWYLAFAFCVWDHARLPTEAEWSFAASEGGMRRYPWSDDDGLGVGPHRALYTQGDPPPLAPSPVGTHHDGRGAYEHEDLAGNVSEWVLDVYQGQLDPQCEENAGRGPHDCVRIDGGWQRALRGGSFDLPLRRLLNANRSGEEAKRSNVHVGFRCARDLE